jgi:hypothetical protein
MSTQPEALRLADRLEGRYALHPEVQQAAAELRRLHAENERLEKLCYDCLGELTALRAAKQMREAINKIKENT